MKIELFLEKLNSDDRVASATKDKHGYKVSLKEGYVFASSNRNSTRETNQDSLNKLMECVVYRSSEEVKKHDELIRLEREIQCVKNSIEWDNKRVKEAEQSIFYSKKRIKEYENAIAQCNGKIEETEKSLEWYYNSIKKETEKTTELEKELEIKKTELEG